MGAFKVFLCLASILHGLECSPEIAEIGNVRGYIPLNPSTVMAEGHGLFDMEEDLFPYHLYTSKSEDREDPFHLAHYNQITKGVTSINGKGVYSSYLALFGKETFPVATDGNNVVIAASLYGKGRVLICGHAGFVLSGNSDPGLSKLAQNAIQWLAQADQLEGIKMAVASGDSVGNLPATNRVSPSDLDNAKYQVYFTTMYNSFGEEDKQKILQFVENGGGLIVAGQIWGWYYGNGGEGNALRNPGNGLIKNFGVLMGSNVGGASALTSNLQKSLYYSLKSVVTEPNLSGEVLETISRTGGIVLTPTAFGDASFKDVFDEGLNAFNYLPNISDKALVSRLVAALLRVILLQNPTSIMKAKDADTFPGSVPDDEERVTKVLTINGTYIGYPWGFSFGQAGSSLMVSTGLYAPAGSVIKVSIDFNYLESIPKPSGLQVQIGCHTDTLYHKPSAPRSPQIVTSSQISGPETLAGNPWGGLVYIKIPRDVNYPMFNVTISNVVRAPYFVLGKNTADEWKTNIKSLSAPWGELEVQDQITFTVPSSVLRNYENPEDLLKAYQEVMSVYNFMQGFQGSYRFRGERIVLDVEISAGWMHSGYPIMGYSNYASSLINVAGVQGGHVWGEFHELGHNAQWNRYTTGATTESGCNVYAHNVNKKLYNETSRLAQSRTDAFLIGFILDGKTGKYGGQVAVISYTLLLDRYGDEHWRNMNKFYMENPSQVDGDAYDVFAWVMTSVMKMNLCPYYGFFAYPLTNRTLNACEAQPPMPDLLIDRYSKVDLEPPPPIGECPSGWIQFSDSCFSIVDSQSVKWDEADKVCVALNNQSHLASCFSEEEAFFLTKHFRKNDIKGSYHVGIDENNEENVAKYLDRSPLPDLLPWQEWRPAKDNKRCTKMEGGWLYDIDCNTNAGVICKSGPTACSPAIKCPQGWVKFMDNCYWAFYGGTKFANAVADCKSKDAQLLEINSQEESDFFNTWVKQIRWTGQYYWRNYWLGMENIPSGKWLSGAPLTYAPFCDKKELASRTGVLASMANSYCWSGLNPTKNEAYICEKSGLLTQ